MSSLANPIVERPFYASTGEVLWRGDDLAGTNKEEEILSFLMDEASDTDFVEIHHPDQLLLDDTGMIGLGYRLTREAFFDLAGKVANFMAPFLVDLVFPQIKNTDPMGYVPPPDYRLAAVIFNAVLKQRFDRAHGLQAVVSRQRRSCEGFVSLSYQWLSHWEAARRVLTAMRALGQKTQFEEFRLAGRRMLLYVKLVDPLFLVPVTRESSEAFVDGFVVDNSETGKGSFSVRRILYRSVTGTRAADPVCKRVRHLACESWETQVEASIRQGLLAVQEEEAQWLRQRVLDLRGTPLGLTAPPAKGSNPSLQIVSQRVARYGECSRQIARAATRWASLRGSYGDTASSFASIEEAYTSRTYYDVFNAIGALALRATPSRQDRLESVAYQLLTAEALSGHSRLPQKEEV